MSKKVIPTKSSDENKGDFVSALRKIASSGPASSHAAIEASKATKPSLHTRFVYNPSKGREPSS